MPRSTFVLKSLLTAALSFQFLSFPFCPTLKDVRTRLFFSGAGHYSRNEGEYPLIAAVAAISPYCSGNSILLRKNDSPATKHWHSVDGKGKKPTPGHKTPAFCGREDGIARTEQDVCDNAQCDYCGAMNGVPGRCSSYDKTVGVSEGAV